MKIPNYDPGFSESSYKQGHPCMLADVFRMLICGPSNSGKTNILLHMLYELLEFDKIYLFLKNLHQNKYQALLQDFAERINPKFGYEVIDVIIPVMKSFHSKSFRWTTKKLLSLMIWFVKATKTATLIILSTDGTETAALYTSLKPSTRCRKTSVITVAIFAFSNFFHAKTSGLRTR